jgi:hypothetical protein
VADLAGDPEIGRRLHRRALELAADSPMAGHLLPFVFGGMIRAARAEDVPVLLAEANASSGGLPACETCSMGLHTYAVAPLADLGEFQAAREQLAAADRTAARWSGGAWAAGVLEARAALQRAEGASELEVDRLLEHAARTFDAAGRLDDADRCRRVLTRNVSRRRNAGGTLGS